MRSALYYPHTTVEHAPLVRTALLLWDRLEFIVPDEHFKPVYEDPLIERAMEIIGHPHCPTPQQKKQTHKHIEGLLNRPLPPIFYYSAAGAKQGYEVYPQKLLPETWKMLADAQMSGQLLPNADYPMTEPAGLTVMSILADCCAGQTRSRITDRGAAYATLAGALTCESDPADSKGLPEEQLVPITLEILNAQSLDLPTLIQFRERERNESGHAIRDLRHRYVDGLEKYVTRLTTMKGNASDTEEIKRQFADDMKIDLAQLKEELRFSKREALFSKDVIVAALAGIGTIACSVFGVSLPIAGALTTAGVPATVGGILGTGNRLLAARRATLQKHPMAYLYELNG
jgi:hypothetical protein